jgi:hypothetical protein
VYYQTQQIFCRCHSGNFPGAVFGSKLRLQAQTVRKMPSLPRSWASLSLLYSCIPTGMRKPTCIVWANLTHSSLTPPPRAGSREAGRRQQSSAASGVRLEPLPASVRARPGQLAALSASHSTSGLCGALYGRAGRLTTPHGGFRPGQGGPGEAGAGADGADDEYGAAPTGLEPTRSAPSPRHFRAQPWCETAREPSDRPVDRVNRGSGTRLAMDGGAIFMRPCIISSAIRRTEQTGGHAIDCAAHGLHGHLVGRGSYGDWERKGRCSDF